MAEKTELCEVHSLSTLPNLRERITALNADFYQFLIVTEPSLPRSYIASFGLRIGHNFYFCRGCASFGALVRKGGKFQNPHPANGP